jgi:hypothetical protein
MDRIRVELSSIDPQILTPCRFVAYSSQMTHIRPIQGLQGLCGVFKVNYGVNLTKNSKIWNAIYLRTFVWDEREVPSYTIMPSLRQHADSQQCRAIRSILSHIIYISRNVF